MTDLDSANAPRFTLEELDDLVTTVVGEPLGTRTLRYYAALGLLSRPAELRGRKAFYAERHLLELVAVKRLQAQGISLAAAQARLAGASTASLRDLAQLPDGTIPPYLAPAMSSSSSSSSSSSLSSPSASHSREDEEFWASPSPKTPPPRLAIVPLDAAVSLTVATRHELSPADLDAVHAAAAELLRVLRERGLVTKEDR